MRLNENKKYHKDVEKRYSNHDLFGVDGGDSRGIEDQTDIRHISIIQNSKPSQEQNIVNIKKLMKSILLLFLRKVN